jgi:hypothetical protein
VFVLAHEGGPEAIFKPTNADSLSHLPSQVIPPDRDHCGVRGGKEGRNCGLEAYCLMEAAAAVGVSTV